MSNNDMVDISVEVEALNLDGIKQNLLDYVQKEAKISIENSVEQAGKSAQDADSSATIAENAALSATDSARQASESLGLYYTKAQADVLLSGKQDAIADLSDIRSGASAGATALQQSDVSSVYSSTGTAPVNGTAVASAISTKANIGLDNLSADGQMIIDSQNGTISNCILEIPQNLKLTLENNVLTLKAGSILTGTGSTYATTTTTADVSLTISSSFSDGKYLIFPQASNSLGNPRAISGVSSGDSNSFPTTGLSDFSVYFNTDDKKIYRYSTSLSSWGVWAPYYPICLIEMKSGVVSFAKDSNGNDMIFNGAGFVGHHAVVYPNVKGLGGNGVNTNGGLNSYKVSNNTLTIFDMTGANSIFLYRNQVIGNRIYKGEFDTIEEAPIIVGGGLNLAYIKNINYMCWWDSSKWNILTGNNSQLLFILYHYDNNSQTVTQFDVRQPVRTATVEMVDKIDSSVVHNSGDEDINGTKSFYNVIKSKNSSYSGSYEGYYYQQSGGSLILGLRAGSTWLNYLQFGTDGNIQYSGTVNVSTPANGDNSTKAATTAFVNNYFTAITGYDATKTQTLKNVSGTLTWVDD